MRHQRGRVVGSPLSSPLSMDDKFPDKLYFKIGEVAAMTGVKAHVLRYWESEFVQFRLNKSSSKQRLYRRQDIELVLRLKDLLYQQGFTIAGARKKLSEGAPPKEEPPSQACSGDVSRDLLLELHDDLLALRNSLKPSP